MKRVIMSNKALYFGLVFTALYIYPQGAGANIIFADTPSDDGAAKTLPIEISESKKEETKDRDISGSAGIREKTEKSHDPSPAWKMYHEAIIRLLEGDYVQSVTLLQILSIEHRGHPADYAAREMLKLLENAADEGRLVSLDPDYRETRLKQVQDFRFEEPSNFARAELVAMQTLHGMVLGVELALIGDVDSEASLMLMLLGGGAGGFGLSLMASREGITAGQVKAINFGTLWGAWNGYGLLWTLLPDNEPLVFMGSHLLGTALGALIWHHFRPHAGQVAFASSAGMWTGIFSAMMMGIVEPNIRDETLMWLLLGLSNSGILAGAYASGFLPMSSGRVRIINLTGALGGLAGMAFSVMVNFFNEMFWGTTMFGAMAGIIGGYYFMQEWDDLPDTGGFALVPAENGGILSYYGRF